MGTFGGALEARQIGASGGLLVGEGAGEIEKEDNVLVVRRIHVKLVLKAQEQHRATAERVHSIFANHCPVYRTLKPAIDITTELAFEPAG